MTFMVSCPVQDHRLRCVNLTDSLIDNMKMGKSSVRVQADAPCECRGPGAVETLRRAADHSHVGM